MKRIFILLMAVACMLSSCSTTESGAVNGASLGSVLGGSLGGLLGGYRGHAIGTMVGMVAGGAGGAAIGSQREASRRDASLENRRQRVEERTDRRADNPNRKSKSASAGNYNPVDVDDDQAATSPLMLRNMRFVGQDGNGVINRGETCTLVFELANVSGRQVDNIVPYISELQGNEHISISPSTAIESLANGDALRYTATLRADSRLKPGTATFRIAVSTEGSEFVRLRDFNVATDK